MSMNDRKMNNYSVIRVGSVLVLAITLVLATFTFPLGTRTSATPLNSPPVFGTPSPVNGSTGNPVSFTWSIRINDTEGDSFNWTIQCSNGQVNNGTGAANGTKSLALSGLAYSTTYKVWANATDPTGSGLYTRKWYTFTTKHEGIFTVVITKPLENHLYLQDQDKMSLSRNTIIYGPITITANVSSETDIAKVEFYVDGKLKETVTAAPYTCLWQPFIQFNGLSLKHTIKVIAYDTQGHNATAELNVTKWRFHVLPFIVAGVAIASRLLLHTTVTGLVFNLKESKIAVSFYAIRTHYKTIGPFKSQRGVINFKSCMGGILIGPTSMTRFGPLHKFAYGSFTILGEVHYKSGRLGQGILGNLLRNALTK